MNELNVGVIGIGKMGLLHSGIFNGLNDSNLVAIAEKDKVMSMGLKKYLPNVEVYTDYEKMIKSENLDILVITTPVFLHKPMIEKANDYNLNIMVEKPLALNSEECKSILNKKINGKTLVGYCRRFAGTYSFVKEIIENSTLGKLISFQSQMFVEQVLDKEKGWQYDPSKSGGGVLIDLGSHAIDLLHYFFGEIDSVNAIGKTVFSGNVEDYVSANFKLKERIMGSMELSWSRRNYRLPELKFNIQFENGDVVVTEKYVEIYSKINNGKIKEGWNTFYKQNLTSQVPLDIGGPEYTLEDLHFIKCINEDKTSLCDFKEAAKTNFVIDSIYSSIKNESLEKIKYGV
ncbi:Gfo/Idh/MocA family oxidoreductase [Methanobacterium alkalithermotolerans]|uniref:Gfo/Idh/MocA family oxidoreductase n=1 Tax=Methanobacterium alkalithermotolerans TaxID=2731220 RepID=A0A8T8K3X3_9EURY|nr:Gfo/Idh/MocA family oxidoreductase [Methanobacterium alkalithermotolerans]QUH22619.1 Gfo/Idh/MocA family oxidoreductase [Methanobacterium alkalithermotolerans]